MNMTVFQRFVDRYVGDLHILLLFPFWVRKTAQIPQTPRRILLIKLWALGESVMTLPAITAIYRRYPKAEITLLTRKRNIAVYQNARCIHSIILLEPETILSIITHWRRYDLAYDLEPFFRISALVAFWLSRFRVGFSNGLRARLFSYTVPYEGKCHVVEEYLSLASAGSGQAEKTNRLVAIEYSYNDAQELQQKYGQALRNASVRICLAPGSGESGHQRRWPRDRYKALISLLLKRTQATIFVIGSKKEKELCATIIHSIADVQRVVNTAGQLRQGELFALLKAMDLFIGNDSGAMHVAAAQGVHTLGIFGPTLPLNFRPYGPGNIALYESIHCSPCIKIHLGYIPKCTNTTYQACMIPLTPERVLQTALTMISNYA